MVQFPVKTYKSFILNIQSERLFQSFLPWAENLSDSPSWYIPAQQMPHRQHLSCPPEKKMIENFVYIASFHCYTSVILLKKTEKQKKKNGLETSKNFKYKDMLSQSRTSSHFSAAPMCHTPSHNQ